eukprot:g7528.t1
MRMRCVAKNSYVLQQGLRGSRGLKTGILGLPNVGKSSLFNALTQNDAKAENFPFCTIDPNVGIVPVPDARLAALRRLYGSERAVPTTLEFVDIAGLVAGASKGEGLGNRFLADVRECDALVHVVRCFEDGDIVHVNSRVDPATDVEVIRLELVLSDLEQVERRRERLGKKGGKKAQPGGEGYSAEAEASALAKVHAVLEEGRCARRAVLEEEEALALRHLGLLSLKPVILAANVAETDLAQCARLATGGATAAAAAVAAGEGVPAHYAALCAAATADDGPDALPIAVSSKVEAELSVLAADERGLFLEELGIDIGMHIDCAGGDGGEGEGGGGGGDKYCTTAVECGPC